MSKTEIRQDVLAPEREWVADFKNVHKPTAIVADMLDLAKWNWRIPSSATFTDRIEWDTTSDPVAWFGEWRFRDKKDQWTTIWNRVICQGTYDKKTKMGDIVVKVKPAMVTKFEWTNPFMAAFYYMYFYTFYKSRLREYMERAQARVRDFDAEIRERLGIIKAEERGVVTRRPR